jgi:RNA polymerase sigma factor (sigma-70 family)
MRDDPLVIDLVTRATAGDQGAWNEIVERYTQLVWSICGRYRLSRDDIDDVGQSVWLLLVENIGRLREPAALPGWLARTTQHECLRALRAAQRQDRAGLPPEDQMPQDADAVMVEQEILVAERHATLRAALAELPRPCRELLSMLVSDQSHHYEDISAALGVPVGSIGPRRARCLERLRRSAHLAAIADGDPEGIEQTGGGR